MQIATWNVNSLNVRLEQLLTWLQDAPMEVVCLQETKLPDERFPLNDLRLAGWQVWFCGQKSYNGMAILSRLEGEAPLLQLPGMASEEKRFLAVTVQGVRVVNVYVPNGAEVGSEKFRFKLAWLEALQAFLEQERRAYPELVVLGDFNIAPEDRDCHDPAAWEGSILVSPQERAAFRRLLGLPLEDTLRRLHPQGGIYSWWDYRAGSFRRNQGIRIDHILASPTLAARLESCHVDATPRAWERPSDHAPVVARFR